MKPKTLATAIILAAFSLGVALYLTSCTRNPETGKWEPMPVRGKVCFTDDRGDTVCVESDGKSITPSVNIKGGTFQTGAGAFTVEPK